VITIKLLAYTCLLWAFISLETQITNRDSELCFMSLHNLFTIIFLIFPIFMIFFKNYYLFKKGILKKGSQQAKKYDRPFVYMIIIYNIYFLIYYYSNKEI